ncbi:MAG: 16S rRNA (guanine(966)-N(2))-methyltransferase RsmD [Elusimicrobia bacterium]|nr:16S rRNA (guanine(966)-N(2))-methyltransferase RsmD [Elusimicrobiota bacterium]
MSGLRIIAGEARGRMLKSLPIEDLSVRPILARIKKSLFDILTPRIDGAHFLDLYAGTGAVGLEALSRGAADVVFVESDKRSQELITANTIMLKWTDRCRIVKVDIVLGLGGVTGKPFDIIFMGPPYKDAHKKPLSLTGLTLQHVCSAGLLSPQGWILSQRHEKEAVVVPPELEQFRSEKYGDTVVVFYRTKSV